MHSINSLLPLIREGKLELHCVNIKIWQEGGIELFGHGIIKINKNGVLYLDFICTKNDKLPGLMLSEKLPKDLLNEKERFYLECETLSGDILKASNFSIEFGLSDMQPPNHKNIILNNISCEETKDEDGDFLYFEFSEHCDIPANKSNSETSTQGYESHSWNESIIDMEEEFKIHIIDEKDYKYCAVEGSFEVSRVFECLQFYIGFTCGSMIQPIYSLERSGKHTINRIHSIRNLQKTQRSSNPVPSLYARENKVDHDYHYQIFKNIYNLFSENPKHYESIYSQWKRVWYSFQSVNSITTLTLSVAIEGLLNDIFIPQFKSLGFNDHLNNEIRRIKSLISGLNLTPDQVNRLKGSISYWKNITASKALEYLIQLQVISSAEKTSWSNLRNSSAHPKTKEMDSSSLEVERQELLLCLNLFHNLIFNTIKYSGPRHYWAVGTDNPLRLVDYVVIDQNSKMIIETKT